VDDNGMIDRLRKLMAERGATTDGFTLTELRESLGLPDSSSARSRFAAVVRQALADGLLERCTVMRETLVGYKQGHPGLRFARPKAKAARRR
jgi:hypothetical protein